MHERKRIFKEKVGENVISQIRADFFHQEIVSTLGDLQKLLFPPLWRLVGQYYQLKNAELMQCPISGKLLTNPALLRHPDVAEVFYDADALKQAIAEGKFHKAGILFTNPEMGTELTQAVARWAAFFEKYDMPVFPAKNDDMEVDQKNLVDEMRRFLEPDRHYERGWLRLKNREINIAHELIAQQEEAKRDGLDYVNLLQVYKRLKNHPVSMEQRFCGTKKLVNKVQEAKYNIEVEYKVNIHPAIATIPIVLACSIVSIYDNINNPSRILMNAATNHLRLYAGIFMGMNNVVTNLAYLNKRRKTFKINDPNNLIHLLWIGIGVAKCLFPVNGLVGEIVPTILFILNEMTALDILLEQDRLLKKEISEENGLVTESAESSANKTLCQKFKAACGEIDPFYATALVLAAVLAGSGLVVNFVSRVISADKKRPRTFLNSDIPALLHVPFSAPRLLLGSNRIADEMRQLATKDSKKIQRVNYGFSDSKFTLFEKVNRLLLPLCMAVIATLENDTPVLGAIGIFCYFFAMMAARESVVDNIPEKFQLGLDKKYDDDSADGAALVRKGL